MLRRTPAARGLRRGESVFRRRDGLEYAPRFDLFRQRQLHEYAVNVVTPIQMFDQRRQLFSSRQGRQFILLRMQPERLAGFDLAPHVNFRSRIISHDHRRESRFDSARFQLAHARGHVLFDLFGNGSAVQYLCCHSGLCTSVKLIGDQLAILAQLAPHSADD